MLQSQNRHGSIGAVDVSECDQKRRFSFVSLYDIILNRSTMKRQRLEFLRKSKILFAKK